MLEFSIHLPDKNQNFSSVTFTQETELTVVYETPLESDEIAIHVGIISSLNKMKRSTLNHIPLTTHTHNRFIWQQVKTTLTAILYHE